MTGRMLSIRNGPADSCAGTDVEKSSRLISVFVSMTTRSLAFFGKDFGQLSSVSPGGRRLGNAVVLVPAEQHGNVPVLTADHYRLTLRSIEHGRECLFGVGRGDIPHRMCS